MSRVLQKRRHELSLSVATTPKSPQHFLRRAGRGAVMPCTGIHRRDGGGLCQKMAEVLRSIRYELALERERNLER